MKEKTLDELVRLMYVHRGGRDLRWVLCHGVFDLLHPGHIVHLEWARTQGDRLIVSITPDHAVQKGPGRPHFLQKHRVDQVAALQVVDYVIPNQDASAESVLKVLQPEVYVKGCDIQREPTPAFKRERAIVESYGGRVAFSPGGTEFHSTEVLKAQKIREALRENHEATS